MSSEAALDRLLALTRHRHAVPVMAELHRGQGAKLVTLVNRTGGSRAAVKQALEHLMERGWVRRPAGHGHPLRPEYELTPDGAPLGAACAQLQAQLRARGLEDVLLRRWPLAALAVLAGGALRFSDLARRLPGITDRALVLALEPLLAAGLVERRVQDGHPPAVTYSASRPARSLALLATRA